MRLSEVTGTASAAFVVRCVTSSIGVQRVNVLPGPEIPTVLVPGGQALGPPRDSVRPSSPPAWSDAVREVNVRQRRGRMVQLTGKRGSGWKTQAVPVRTVVSR